MRPAWQQPVGRGRQVEDAVADGDPDPELLGVVRGSVGAVGERRQPQRVIRRDSQPCGGLSHDAPSACPRVPVRPSVARGLAGLAVRQAGWCLTHVHGRGACRARPSMTRARVVSKMSLSSTSGRSVLICQMLGCSDRLTARYALVHADLSVCWTRSSRARKEASKPAHASAKSPIALYISAACAPSNPAASTAPTMTLTVPISA